MSLPKQLQLKWSKGTATVATVDLLQKLSVAKVASTPDEGNTQPKHLFGFDPYHDNEKDDLENPPKLVGFEAIYDSDPLLKKLLNLGSQISDYWNDSDAARAEMMASILSYPPNKREALAQALISSLRTQQ